MRPKTLLPALLLCACAHAPAGNDTTASLVAAERAFARSAQDGHVTAAFLAVLADDATIFRPAPVNGPAFMREHPMPDATILRWSPSYAETSADGNLGYTSGPYLVGSSDRAETATGHFLSIWRRTEGKWQLVFDGGEAGAIEFPVDSAAAHLQMRALQRRFAPDTVSLLSAQQLGPEYKPERAIVAGSGDLGYVFGVKSGAPNQPARGYLRIFRRAADGTWQLARALN